MKSFKLLFPATLLVMESRSKSLNATSGIDLANVVNNFKKKLFSLNKQKLLTATKWHLNTAMITIAELLYILNN